MGFRALQWWRQRRPRGLDTTQICMMWEACYSCLDDTAHLDASVPWFMEKCGMGERSVKRHLPRLATLELLVRGDQGFRLPLFFAYECQFGPSAGCQVGANLAQERKEPKERIMRKEDLEGTPLPPLQGGILRNRDQRKRDRVRANFDTSPGLQPFRILWCELCPVPHEWRLEEPGYRDAVEDVACPEWREKLKTAPAAVGKS